MPTGTKGHRRAQMWKVCLPPILRVGGRSARNNAPIIKDILGLREPYRFVVGQGDTLPEFRDELYLGWGGVGSPPLLEAFLTNLDSPAYIVKYVFEIAYTPYSK